MKKIIYRWLFLLLSVTSFIGGMILANLHESHCHNVSLYDAMFIESWKHTGH